MRRKTKEELSATQRARYLRWRARKTTEQIAVIYRKSVERRRNKVAKMTEAERAEYNNKNNERQRLARLKCPQRNRDHCKSYYYKNAAIARRKSVAYITRKRKTDPAFRLFSALRCRIGNAIRSAKAFKNSRTSKLLGCTPHFLCRHLEAMFTNGMTWDNYGQWHVDHIRPCALYDLTKEDQQMACFHYTNLQPLWAKDNMSKGVKVCA